VGWFTGGLTLAVLVAWGEGLLIRGDDAHWVGRNSGGTAPAAHFSAASQTPCMSHVQLWEACVLGWAALQCDDTLVAIVAINVCLARPRCMSLTPLLARCRPDASRVPAPVATRTLPWPFASLAGSRRRSRHNCCSATTGCRRRTSRRRRMSGQTLSAPGEACTTTTARVWTSPTTSIPSARATCRSYRHVKSMLHHCHHLT
jgi:hypothetical protein